MHDASPVATLCLTTFGRVMTPRIVTQHLPVLQATAEAIAQAYAAALPAG
jgi:hypothetical protein